MIAAIPTACVSFTRHSPLVTRHFLQKKTTYLCPSRRLSSAKHREREVKNATRP